MPDSAYSLLPDVEDALLARRPWLDTSPRAWRRAVLTMKSGPAASDTASRSDIELIGSLIGPGAGFELHLQPPLPLLRSIAGNRARQRFQPSKRLVLAPFVIQGFLPTPCASDAL
jgi:hypothetical protein